MAVPLRFLSFPGARAKHSRENPYVTLFYEALRRHEIELVGELTPEAGWLREHSDGIDAIHIHWPERIWRARKSKWSAGLENLRGYYLVRRLTQWPRAIAGFRHLRPLLQTAKDRGIRVIWTIHDLVHHEGSSWLDLAGYRMLAEHSDVIICHSQSARQEFLNSFSMARNVLVMKHGNYSGEYPVPRARELVMRELGLRPDRPLVACLGLIRKYKGVDTALEACRRVGEGVQIVVGGAPFRGFPVHELARAVASNPNARLIARHLSEQEFADYSSAADAFLLPYRRITTSGAMQAAFTFHRGVVASDLPYFRETLADQPDAGRLFEMENPEAMAEAIVSYLAIPSERRMAAARTLAEEHAWDRVVMPVVDEIAKWRSSCGAVERSRSVASRGGDARS